MIEKTINQDLSKSAIQYNQQNLEKINSICAPLKDYFGINYFGYWRVFNDGRYILVSNNRCFQEVIACYDFCFRSEYFSEMTQYLYKKELYKKMWPNNVKDGAIKILQENGLYNGFNIIREKEETIETYFFATDKARPLIKEFYLNNSAVLEEFISYFHKMGYDLCDPSDVRKQGISPYLRKTYPYIENIFEGVNLWEKKKLEFNLLINSKLQEEIKEVTRRNYLSPREFQCLTHISTGKTAKEIALILNISPRTVETHVDKIRLKTTCNTQKEIIQWFEDKFKYLLKNQG
jgi:DNA-binding CsgD family transcriptional regulator